MTLCSSDSSEMISEQLSSESMSSVRSDNYDTNLTQTTTTTTTINKFKNNLISFLFGQHRQHKKLSVITRYLVITYAMTLFTFILLIVFRFSDKRSEFEQKTGETEITSIVVQLIWALSPLTATLFICFGRYKLFYAPLSIINPEIINQTEDDNDNVAYSIWNWKMRVFYHFSLNKNYNNNNSDHSPQSQTILPFSQSNHDLSTFDINASPSPSPSPSPTALLTSSSLSLSLSSCSSISIRPNVLLPHFPHFLLFFRHFTYQQHYPLLLLSWFLICLFFTSFSSFFQYIISLLFFACNIYSSSFFIKISSILNMSSSSSCIFLAFLYTFIFGFIWDIFPPIAVDWGVGMGFSGCSWFLLSFIEEIGWAVLLFPAFINYMKGDVFRASIWTGFIWSTWHYPAVLFSSWNIIPHGTGYSIGLSTTPLLYGFITFTLSTIALRVLICHVSIQSGSFYTSVIFHALHNVFAISFFQQLPEIQSNLAAYMIAECGIVLCVIYCLSAYFVMKKWKNMYVFNNNNYSSDSLYDDISEKIAMSSSSSNFAKDDLNDTKNYASTINVCVDDFDLNKQ